mgnify:CR=1 FL=1
MLGIEFHHKAGCPFKLPVAQYLICFLNLVSDAQAAKDLSL